MTFRIRVALESLQYLDNHEPQRFDFCIECTPTVRPCLGKGQGHVYREVVFNSWTLISILCLLLTVELSHKRTYGEIIWNKKGIVLLFRDKNSYL